MEQRNESMNTCPLCSASSAKAVIKFERFSVMKCPICHGSWRSNMYNHDTVEQLYSDDDYARNPFFRHGDSSAAESDRRRLIHYDNALDYVESQSKAGKLLDVGCGNGAFLSVAEKRGWHVEGIELSPALCEICKSRGFDVKNIFFEEADLPEKSYDLISFWDTIEHVLDPNFVVQKAKSLLAPGGILLFCTPNEESLLARVGIFFAKYTPYQYPGLALHPPFHTFFFGGHDFVNLLERNNLKVTRRYSQKAFFEHSSMASSAQKAGIELIEQIASPFDACYDMVVFARGG